MTPDKMTPDIIWHKIEEMTDEIRNSGRKVLFWIPGDEDSTEVLVCYWGKNVNTNLLMWQEPFGLFREDTAESFAVLNTPEESEFSVMVEIPETDSKGRCGENCPLMNVDCYCNVGLDEDYKPGLGCPRHKESL